MFLFYYIVAKTINLKFFIVAHARIYLYDLFTIVFRLVYFSTSPFVSVEKIYSFLIFSIFFSSFDLDVNKIRKYFLVTNLRSRRRRQKEQLLVICCSHRIPGSPPGVHHCAISRRQNTNVCAPVCSYGYKKFPLRPYD